MKNELIKLSYPVIVSRFLNVILDIISVFIVAHLGLNTLSAYGIFIPIYLTISMIAISYLLIFPVKASHLQGDEERLSIYIGSGVLFSLGLSVVVILILCLVPTILPYLGQAFFVTEKAGDFFYYISLGMPALFTCATISQAPIDAIMLSSIRPPLNKNSF